MTPSSGIQTKPCFGRLLKFSTHSLAATALTSLSSLSHSSYCSLILKSLRHFSLLIRQTSFSSIRALHSSATVHKSSSSANPAREAKMTVTVAPCIRDGVLSVNGKVVSTGVPSNIAVYPGAGGSAFVGATSSTPSCRHCFSLGVLQDYKFLSLFRFKIWWMIPRVGTKGSEIPMETQMLLLEAKEESALHNDECSDTATGNTIYILLLPVLEGPFRASLQGTPLNGLEFCIESGDVNVQTTQVLEAVFVNSGDNPFELIRNSIKILEKHKGTFTHIENKKVPVHLDWFGWCTWDAFYKDVSPQGIKEGLQSLLDGGCPPRFLIIDDGWQETVNTFCKEGEPFIEGTQFALRLVNIKENSKFKGLDSCADLREFIKLIKEEHGVNFVYMWHALVGYWGGLLPSSEPLKKYNPRLVHPKQSPGNVGNIRDIAMDEIEKYGVGLIDPEKIYDFYSDQHAYLASCGVDGVKVDVQNVLETLGAGFGGRVSLTRKYQYALEQSIVKNFRDNSLICCMCHNTDSIYSSKKSAVARASEDFMPREPTLQTLHVASVAFNSLLLGEIFSPDWDMFHSRHDAAEFHGAARAVGGCGVYVSDKPGTHDFKILKKLVLPDGSILRAKCPGRPTRDCLFTDPVMDGKSLLKIWNLNKFSGIIGVFNCQGAGIWPCTPVIQDIPISESPLAPIAGCVHPLDVEYIGDIAGDNWNGDCAVYAFHSGSLSRLPKDGNLDVSLASLQCEIFTVSPIMVFDQALHFAPIGLVDMYNSGGAIKSFCPKLSGSKIRIKSQGCGRFGAYSSAKPSSCTVDMKGVEFAYNAENGLLIFQLDMADNVS